VVDAPTLADFCDHVGVTHPPHLADIQRDVDADIDDAYVFADTLPTLRAIRDRGLRVTLTSNLASPYKRAVTRLTLDSHFDAILYSCDLGIAMHDPAIYRAALSQLGSPPESTLMVGDNQRSDVDGPMACGIRSLLLDRDGESSGDSVLRALSDVTSHLRS
jgi:HAD superfamily hydrolase (TIGR01549 family)